MRAGPAARGLAALAAILLPASAAAQTLRYGGQPGERARYRLENTARIHQETPAGPSDLTVRSFSLLALLLESANADTLAYAVTFDSLALTFEGAPVTPPDLTPLKAGRVVLRLSPRGDVHAFEVPADMPPPPPGFDLKQMLSHFFPRLPGTPAPPGTTWSDTLSVPVSQQGIESQVQVVTTYTSRGKTNTPEGAFVEVGYGTVTTLRGTGRQDGTPVALEGSGRGSGTILLGDDGATFWSSKGTQTLELQVRFTPEGQEPVSIPIRQEIASEIQRQ